MRILVTNDDSINSPVLPALVAWAQKLGEVTVVVPKYEQSAKSHSIEIHKPFEVLPCDAFPGVTAYTVDSTPADCVRYAFRGLHQQFDLVISGINRGLNVGKDILYSGTLSAAFEAVFYHCKALALSTQPESFDPALAHLDDIWSIFEQRALFEKNDIYNVNIPLDVKGIRFTRQGGAFFSEDFPSIGDNLVRPTGVCIYEEGHDYSIDTDAVSHGYLSITPLTPNRTNLPLFEELSRLNP